ncbi:hypothetical protein CBR_g11224 [Chara braunii]|uniref:Tyr recombinase domain-containing protein n=1 Tax=Chara braunii TaxID=69332 RepID=A0A388KQI2_CHABU|nr:hypothetical protein CBR_g11224 [Chara braunii]|eukprot:GBG72296.1 hypothetical protein CBR_g11224 [Chara braunii]
MKGYTEAQAYRDGGAFLYLWESWQRCGEGLRLQYKEIDIERGVVCPVYTKTNWQGRRFMIQLRDPRSEEETFLGWLPEMMASYERVGQDLRSGYLFGPVRGDGPMSGGGFNKRIEKWFEAVGVFEGESGHSFRIGEVQAGIEEGWSLGEMMRQSTWSQVGTFMRYGYRIKRGWKRKSEGQLREDEDCRQAKDFKVGARLLTGGLGRQEKGEVAIVNRSIMLSSRIRGYQEVFLESGKMRRLNSEKKIGDVVGEGVQTIDDLGLREGGGKYRKDNVDLSSDDRLGARGN